MKKLKFEGKLKLNKETIAKLNDEQMSNVKGGNRPITAGTGWFCGCNDSCCVGTACGRK